MLRFVVLFLFVEVVLSSRRRIIDLSHTLDENAPKIPLDGFGFGDNMTWYKNVQLLAKEYPEQEMWLELRRIEFYEHQGTHIDAPNHFGRGRQAMHEIPPERLIGPGVIVDVREKARVNPDYAVTVDDIKAYEELYGRIPAGAIVIMNSGWSEKYPHFEQIYFLVVVVCNILEFGSVLTFAAGKWVNRKQENIHFLAYEESYGRIPAGAIVIMNSGWSEKYPNQELMFGSTDFGNFSAFHYPGWSIEACRFLNEERRISVLGVDTTSTDPAQLGYLDCHRYLQPLNVPLLEYVGNLHNCPPNGTTIFLGVPKIRDGTGAPTRIFAVIDDDTTCVNNATFTRFGFSNIIISVALIFIKSMYE